MKIIVITPLFALAGVPLAQLRLSRALANAGHEVEFIIGHIDKNYSLPSVSNINIKILNIFKVRNMLFPLILHFFKTKPDIIFSAEDHLNIIVLLASIFSFQKKIKISCSSRVTPYDTYSNIFLSKGWFLKHIMKIVMWRSNVLTCVSKDMVKQYQNVFNNTKHVCAYNIIIDNFSLSRLNENVEHKWINNKKFPLLIAAGRLASWKGFDNLIKSVKILSDKHDFRLLILGDGPQRQFLQALIKDLDLENKVELVGYVENPLKYFSKADVFVLSSIVEGLPNVLVEAMMCGCTPVATNCPTGPSEVLQNSKYGYLVPVNDPKSMANAIELAILKPINKSLLEEAILSFEEKIVINHHFNLLRLNN